MTSKEARPCPGHEMLGTDGSVESGSVPGKGGKKNEGARGLVRNRYMMTMTMICNQRLWVLLLMLYFVAWVFILLFFLF